MKGRSKKWENEKELGIGRFGRDSETWRLAIGWNISTEIGNQSDAPSADQVPKLWVLIGSLHSLWQAILNHQCWERTCLTHLLFHSLVTSKPESFDTDMALLVFRMDRNRFTSECPDWRYPLPETKRNNASWTMRQTLHHFSTQRNSLFIKKNKKTVVRSETSLFVMKRLDKCQFSAMAVNRS